MLITTDIGLLGVMVITSVEVRHDITVRINVVESDCASKAFVIVPVTVTEYSPAKVGAYHDISLVDVSNVIKDVL